MAEHSSTIATRPNWGAVLTGSFVTLGVGLLLAVLGAAIFFSAAQSSPGGAMNWIEVWSLILPVIAVFIGAVCCARVAGPTNRFGAALHGASVWGFSYVIGIAVVGLVSAPVISTVGNLAGSTVSAAGSLVGSAGQLPAALGLNGQTLLAPVNQQLRADGDPPITAQQLDQAVQLAIRDAARTGQFNQQVFAQSLAQATRLSPQQANQVIGQAMGRVRQGGNQVGSAVSGVFQNVLGQAAYFTWWSFASIVVALGAALLGAGLGVSHEQREAEDAALTARFRREVFP